MTEMAIQQVLLDAGATDFDRNLVTVHPQGLEVAADWANLRSPETYLGYGQATGFASPGPVVDVPRAYETVPLRLNQWALNGTWTFARHAALLNEPGGKIAFCFHGRDVNLVMGPASKGKSIAFRVVLDGQPPAAAHGSDVDADGRGILNEQNTYQLIRQDDLDEDHLFEIEFLDAGAEAYCFTFG